MKPNYLYLLIDFFSILFPLLFSFHPKFNFSKKWKHLWPALLITAVLFIIWDIAFTKMNVWSFNDKYITGIYLINLPIEEVLFFICIPYSCVFLYETLKYFQTDDIFAPAEKPISLSIVTALTLIALFYLDRWYTSVTFLAVSVFLFLLSWWWRAAFLSRFYFSYLVTLVPFFIVNGILTGSVTEEPVVIYNKNEMIGLRVGTIPVEDFFYGMLMLLINITLFERSQSAEEKKGSSFS